MILFVFFLSVLCLVPEKAFPEDWVVTGAEIVEGGSITLGGNLHIEPGGGLTLRGAALNMASTYDGQYEIRVRAGGSLTIEEGSAIARSPDAAGFNFIVEAGSTFIMRNSRLSQCGWGAPAEDLGGEQVVLSGARGLTVDADEAIIEGNTLCNNHVGVLLCGDRITLKDNHIHSNTVHGIFTHKASNCRIEGNNIEHSTVSSPFRMCEGGNNTVVGNTIQIQLARGAIEVFTSNGNTFQGNTIKGLGVAIAIYSCSHNNVVVENDLHTNETGVIIWGWNNRVEDNTIDNQEVGVMTGIFMVYAYNSVVARNTMSGIDASGIWMRDSSNNAIISNVISGAPPEGPEAYYGMLLNNSSRKNIIYGNQVSAFSRGISVFYGSDANIVAGNSFSENTLHAALIDDASANIFYGNNFVGSGRPPYDSGANRWDNEGMGNYWSDYSGTDSNHDGIGDEPYRIEPAGIDRFPLMAPLTQGAVPVPEVETASRPVVGPQFSKTITGTEVIANQSVYLGCIEVENGGNLTLRNVHLITGGGESNSDLHVSPGGSLTIENCEISHLQYGCGFQLQPPAGATFVMRGSLLQTCGHEWPYGGLQIYTDDLILENNHFVDSQITLFGTSGGLIAGNTMEQAGQGISLAGSSNVVVTRNTIRKMIGAAVQACGSNNRFTENTICETWEFGINVYNSSNCFVGGNSITDLMSDRSAISVGGDRHRVLDNLVSECGLGIRIGQGHIAKGNTVINCALGMEIGWNSSRVEDNTISNCTLGIDLSGESHTLLSNTISNCETGLKVAAANNTLHSNTISNCATGVKVAMAANNLFYHNNFIGNTQQATDNGFSTWDKGAKEGGNYWSDYAGMDADGNGIGDTPYFIAPEGVDHYPLMVPFRRSRSSAPWIFLLLLDN